MDENNNINIYSGAGTDVDYNFVSFSFSFVLLYLLCLIVDRTHLCVPPSPCLLCRVPLSHSHSSPSLPSPCTTPPRSASSTPPNALAVDQGSAVASGATTGGRRHRHSLSGQMSYVKMLGFGVGGKKASGGGSTNSLFSTAVISGSSSAPNLRDVIPNSASVSGESNSFVFDICA